MRQGRGHWISKTLAQIGRYKDKRLWSRAQKSSLFMRPYGLEVDNNGCITLSNLMDSWGHQNGVSTAHRICEMTPFEASQRMKSYPPCARMR